MDGKPVDNMLTGAKIRYRLGTSHNLREGYIISCSDGYAWITDTQSQQVAYIHKSGIIFDSIPNTGIRMPRADEVKYVGPVQTGKLESDQLESQLYDRTEVQKTGLHQEEEVLEQQRLAQSPRNYRLTQLPHTLPVNGFSTRRTEKSPRQRTPRSNGFYVRKDTTDLENEARRSQSSAERSEHHSRASPRHHVPGGFYFHDDAGKLFFQQDSGLTFYVDSNNMFYPLSHRRKSKRHVSSADAFDMVAGADPRLVPELFEGWTDEKGVWYPRSSAPRDRHRQGPKKRLFEDKARENPFLWQNKSMEERVQAQLEHYFSPGNLETDSYLKSLMDFRGYVESNAICSFHRMQHHHVSVGLVLQAAQQSKLLKVKGTRIRSKHAWWLHMKRYVPAEEREDSVCEDEIKEVDAGIMDEDVKQEKTRQVNEDMEDLKADSLDAVDASTSDETKDGTVEKA